MPIINRIAEFHREMTDWRHDLHAHPELSLQETRTSGVVQAKLKAFGVDEIITGMARTGVVGVIRGQGSSAAPRGGWAANRSMSWCAQASRK
jgi:hippurate hydrolase